MRDIIPDCRLCLLLRASPQGWPPEAASSEEAGEELMEEIGAQAYFEVCDDWRPMLLTFTRCAHITHTACMPCDTAAQVSAKSSDGLKGVFDCLAEVGDGPLGCHP